MPEILTHEEFVRQGREALGIAYGGKDEYGLPVAPARTLGTILLPEALDRIELLLLENLRLRSLMMVQLPSEITIIKKPEGGAPGEPELGSVEDLRSRFGGSPKSETDKPAK